MGAHFGKPFIVFLSPDWVGVTDQLNIIFVQNIGNRIQPMVKFGDLLLSDVIAATSEINAFADLVSLLLSAHQNRHGKYYNDQLEPHT